MNQEVRNIIKWYCENSGPMFRNNYRNAYADVVRQACGGNCAVLISWRFEITTEFIHKFFLNGSEREVLGSARLGKSKRNKDQVGKDVASQKKKY